MARRLPLFYLRPENVFGHSSCFPGADEPVLKFAEHLVEPLTTFVVLSSSLGPPVRCHFGTFVLRRVVPGKLALG